MKKLYTLLVVALATLSSTAQIVNIPDANFKARLLAASSSNTIAYNAGGTRIKIDINNDGQIQVSEALSVYSLYVQSSSIQNLTGIEAFLNLRTLWCYSNQLTTLDVTQNTALSSLRVNNNQLTSLDVTQNTALYDLKCFDNLLTSLNVGQNTSLIILECYNNQLTSLVTLNIPLIDLQCYGNQLTSLNVSQNIALKILYCYNNELTSLDVTQNTDLQDLRCYFNSITSLNVTQNTALKVLDCSYNLLTSLDVTQNPALETLLVYVNQLTSLNVTQNAVLYILKCDYNQLTSLDVTHNTGLENLGCGGNQLINLDVSQNPALSRLYCIDDPQLTSLFIKNGRALSWLDLEFQYNPNLQYICADEGDLSYVQNKIDSYWMSETCHVNTYCSFVPGGTYYTIQGSTLFDSNNNGCDVSDINVKNQRLNITSGSVTGSLIANQTGVYYIPVQTGTHTVTPNFENPSYFLVSPTSATVTFPATSSPFTQDFCVTANGVHNDVEVSILPIGVARPGFDAQYKIIYKNKGNQVSNGTLSFSFDDAKMDLVSALPVNTGSATNSLSWSYSNLNPFETRVIDLTFNINSPMETPAVNADDILNYTATIDGATDEMPSDNTFTLNQTVVNSYDPNDKTCLEGATITPSMVGNYVHYVIRFENTGTFPAENIVVADVIDTTKFDLATLVPQSSSHSFVTRINSGKVEFIFENINLPFDDANNDGYVAFKIKTKPTLVVGDTFSNTANIYFDYNFPIVTNTAMTTITALSNQDFDFGSCFNVYPNPAKDVLHLATKNEIGVKSVSIYNALGQMVLVVTNPENNATIDVANLKAGTYFIKVTTDKGTANTKFIKE